MKVTIMIVAISLLGSISAHAGTFFVQDVPGLQASVDSALAGTTTGKARARDAQGNVYRVQVTSQSNNCRSGVVISSRGDTAQSSICKRASQRRSSVRTHQSTVQQQMLSQGYAKSMSSKYVDIGPQYALRGYENAPYQDRVQTHVDLNNLHNMSYEDAKKYMAIEKLRRDDEMYTTRINKSAASAATAWTSGAYNRGYSQESYPGQHTAQRVNDWIDIANRISNISW